MTEINGMPPKESPFHPSELRAFYKFPFCHERKKDNDDVKYDKIEDFYNKMKELDDYFTSDEIKEQLFGKNKYKYEYQPLVKSVRDDIHLEGENVRTNMYRPPCLKLKIEVNYATKYPNLILYDKNEADNTRNKIELNKVDDLYNYMKYLSKVRGIVEVN